jgi:ABC-type lipoprotein release transport system permease subunit
MLCVLSVFNGFSDIAEKTFGSFDPDLKITAKKGKTFNWLADDFQRALKLEGINMVSESLEENALFKYQDRQVPVLIKGVSEDFRLMADMDALVLDGQFKLSEDVVDYATLGVGLAMTLGIRAGFVNPIEIYAPKRTERINLANPASAFTPGSIQIGGVFSLNQPKYDDQMAVVPIKVARNLFLYNDSTVTSLDVDVRQGASVKTLKKEIQKIIGDGFWVQDRFEQQAESYRMLQIEKWVTFLILGFILILAVFNVVGSLSMLIVEKRADIDSLQNMGASTGLVSRIFLYEGCLIAFFGFLLGLVLGLVLCLLQQHFGLLRLSDTPGAYIVDAYPVIVRFADIVIVLVAVSVVSLLTVFYSVNNLKKKLNKT